MNKYNDSKVYKIVDNTNGNIYIGSTTHKYISQRLVKHRCAYKLYLEGCKKYMTSFKILENGDYDIILLENVNCETKDQLTAKERYYIETLECVNLVIPGRTKQEWENENIDKIKLCKKKCYENAKEKRSEVIECDCGSIFQMCEKPRHNKSKKHQAFFKINK